MVLPLTPTSLMSHRTLNAYFYHLMFCIERGQGKGPYRGARFNPYNDHCDALVRESCGSLICDFNEYMRYAYLILSNMHLSLI
ncbi:hypothetical protein L1887_35185 [Cichorium endivia]|nr:hypothetical protein L1887_35185 [Cichorium endivia]